MSVEIPQHVAPPHESISGLSQNTIQVSPIDRLSRLPPELLDHIFELATDTHTLATVPPSRYLELYHRRALYRSVSIGHHETLSRLATTLHKRPSRGHLIRRIVWKCDYSDVPFLPDKSKLRKISEHVPNLYEMNFTSTTEIIAYYLTVNIEFIGLVRSLHICRFVDADLSSIFVKGFSRSPNLHRVEFSFIGWDDYGTEEDQQVAAIAPQVSEVVIKSTNYASDTQISNPSKLVQFFPNAAFVSVDLTLNDFGPLDSVQKLLQQIPPTLRSLILRDRWNDNDDDNSLVDVEELLPRFPHLQHLHLDPPLYSYHELKSTLAPLKSLVSLSLAFSQHLDPPSLLVDAVRQLPLLRKVKLEYFGVEEGEKFDIELAESQFEALGRDLEEDEELPALELVEDLSQMKGWKFPFGRYATDTLLEAVEMEKQLKANHGLVVSSNLEQIRRAYHRLLIEWVNREIGEIYFYGLVPEVEAIYWIAEELGLALPPLEIDLSKKDLLVRNKLGWFKVDMAETVGDGGGECLALGLRYKAGVQSEEVDESKSEVVKGSSLLLSK
ncbi:hypothetical protein JCM5350_003434 [Sporobolomyces pararoseus]